MKSYAGYKNGIVPLLEALGCAEEDILTNDEFVALCAGGENNYNAIIGAIIDPLLNLVDRVYDDPINTLMEILPNVLYFLSCGNLQVCVENVMQSVFVLLDTVRPIYNLSFDLDLDVQRLLPELLATIEVNGQPLALTIPFLSDFSQLCVGTVTPYQSASGEIAYRLEDVDQADFVTVLMRNIVDLIFYQENINTVVDLVGSYVNMSDENKATLAEILGTFAETYKEDNGVDKILNAVYVIYKGVYDAGEGAISGLGDLNDRWSAVFEMLYNSGNPVLEELAKTADELLDWLTFGFITGEGIGTAGLIDFFDRLSAFFTGRVTDVSISQTEADMYEGTTMTLSLSFKPVTVKNTNAAWTTSDASIATVENGVVTAVGPGDAEITATTEDGGLVVSCVVRVRADKTALNEAIAFVESTELTEEQAAAIETTLNAAKYVRDRELATQEDVDSVTEVLLDALKSLDLGGSIESVVITQNGEAVGQVVYQQVKWYNRWNSTPVELGIQINEGANVRSITWSYANWSVDDPEADIEAAEDGMTALIRAKNSVVGAHSCWIQVTVEDVYGNKVTSDPVKVRFYNYDWQK
ncbi:MAG: Ig-like domain-containing protein [Clostridiales bacterium]|nr:Ig-like domain-containing protein [Clostridiales bacterium]